MVKIKQTKIIYIYIIHMPKQAGNTGALFNMTMYPVLLIKITIHFENKCSFNRLIKQMKILVYMFVN